MPREMLINTVQGQECRIAIVQDGRLDELYVERVSSASHVGNIYKGRITNVESAIQAAFVDFGPAKNGFLHISDVHPQYFPQGRGASEAVGRKRSHRDRPPIQDCLKRGQEVVVQMTKEGIGTKGPTMTTYLSIPGRLLVMMPGMSRLGVSRKIEDEEERQRAKDILAELSVPEDMGFIVRTAGLNRSKRDMQRDLNYLLRLWKVVKGHIKRAKNPSEIYQESDLVTRTIRDIYNNDIERVICDDADVARTVIEFLKVAVPRGKYCVEIYAGKEGLFHDFSLESEIEKIYSRRVELVSGGSLVIDQTEALVAIDVNSGRFRKHTDAETTATRLNMEAAQEIARQLRLRDLGGVIIIDFVDMREEKNRRTVERVFRDAIKPDRAKTKVMRISPLGLLEMTRQRTGESLVSNVLRRCEHCEGAGSIKSEESQALLIMRQLQRACAIEDVAVVEAVVIPSVAHYLNNLQRNQIVALEKQSGKKIIIIGDAELAGEELRVTCVNVRGSKIAWDSKPLAGRSGKAVQTMSIEDVPVEESQGQPAPQNVTTAASEEPESAVAIKSKRRRRRGAKRDRLPANEAAEDADEMEDAPEAAPTQADDDDEPALPDEADDVIVADSEGKGEGEEPKTKPRRRGKRGGRKHRHGDTKTEAGQKGDSKGDSKDTAPSAESGAESPAVEAPGEEAAPKPKRRGKRGGRKHRRGGTKTEVAQESGDKGDSKDTTPSADSSAETPSVEAPSVEASGDEDAPKPNRRRRRRKPAATKSETSDEAPAVSE